ncbi:MAG: hypothetical protein KIG85_01890 [Thiopseudomonas sp.]|nr:hypothetical protein [Thiopseudomonas sp.]
MDLHIDDFYRDAAQGLVMLYQSFPRPLTLYMDDFVGILPPDEVGLPHPRQQQCLSTLLWLASEGYLRHHGTLGYTAVDQAELSEKAFVRLSSCLQPLSAELASLPASIRRVQGSLAQQLRQHLKAGDSERLIAVMQQFFSMGR